MYKAQCSGCGRELRLQQHGEEPLWEDLLTADWTCRYYGSRLVQPGVKRFMHGPHYPFVIDPHVPSSMREKLGILSLQAAWDRRVSDMLFDMLKDVA